MPKKRSNDEMEVDPEEIEDDDKDDDIDSDDDNDNDEEKAPDHDMDEVMESPSPETKKKDMRLRSGRRKRRRSKETTGLTPPDQVSKKSRLTEKKKAAAKTGNKQEADESLYPPPQQEVHSPQANGSLPPSQQQAAAASIPVAASLGDASHESSPEQAGRKLFDSTPPPPPAQGAMTKADSRNVTETKEPTIKENAVQSSQAAGEVAVAASVPDDTLPRVDVKHPSIPPSPVATSNGHHLEEEMPVDAHQEESLDYHWAVSFLWMIFFGGLFLVSLPYSVDLSDAVVPLDGMIQEINETELYSKFEKDLLSQLPPIEKDLPKEDDDDIVDVAMPNIPAAIQDGLRSLQTLQYSLEKSKLGLDSIHMGIQRTIDKASVVGGNRKRNSDNFVENLHIIREKLSVAVEDPTDLFSQTWKEVLQANEFRIPDTTLLQLWEIDDPFMCSDDEAEEEKVVIDPDILSPGALEQEFADVMERTQMSVDNLRNDHDVEGNIRQWIRSQIETSVRQNEDANDALLELASKLEGGKSGDVIGDDAFSAGCSAEDIETLISNRLEIEMADRTGKYDHASLLNGGKVIYGGKRGTSKSLVDDLPLYNRIMQVSKLRFYGFGPEAAIVPTWPSDALGQCWSFQQTPVKELMKRRRNRDNGDANDHKRGSFGTLTISLPHPVNVKSIVVEHPPRGLTDNPKSAIRNFRVIGYPDPMAAGKSWSLGSFEYDIANKISTQEFQVATEIFRTLVPPLQSITLAIDSNWGHDFACLYRLRVHGELEE